MKIAMYDLEGHLLEVFEVEFYKDLEEKLKLPSASVFSCIKGRQHRVANKQFKELAGTRPALQKIGDISGLINGGREFNIVIKYYNGKVVTSYNTVKDAYEKNDIKASSLVNCLLGKTKTCGGFTWKYAE